MPQSPAPRQHLYSQLPKVDVLLEAPDIAALPRSVALPVIRQLLDELRDRIGSGELRALPDVVT